jgi:hypothetical protein
MSTAPAPTGALSRREAHAPTGPQTKPFDTTSHPAGRMQSETAGYRPLCAHGMNSLTDRGYDLALGRLRRG